MESLQLDDLPKELACEVLLCLPAPTVAKSVQLLSQQWRELARDDFIWRRKLRRDFGGFWEESRALRSRAETCPFDLYKQIMAWGWEPHLPQVQLKGKIAHNISRHFGVALSRLPLTAGVHYFEFEARLELDARRTVGFGVATRDMITAKSFERSNRGIGWYNTGELWVRGDCAEPERLPCFQRGDKCGMLVDLECGVLRFYLNGKPLEPEVALAPPKRNDFDEYNTDDDDDDNEPLLSLSPSMEDASPRQQQLHAVSLFHTNQVGLHYFGRVVPTVQHRPSLPRHPVVDTLRSQAP